MPFLKLSMSHLVLSTILKYTHSLLHRKYICPSLWNQQKIRMRTAGQGQTVCCVHVRALSCLDSVTLRTIACQALLCMEISRQEYWSGLPFPSPGELPNPGIKLVSRVFFFGRRRLYQLSQYGAPRRNLTDTERPGCHIYMGCLPLNSSQLIPCKKFPVQDRQILYLREARNLDLGVLSVMFNCYNVTINLLKILCRLLKTPDLAHRLPDCDFC